MREIKFRVYIKDESKICEESKPVFSGLKLELYEVSTISFDAGFVAINVENANLWFPLDAVELMQFTGLKDYKCREVYDGDKIALQLMVGKKYGTVYWHCEEHAFKVRWWDDKQEWDIRELYEQSIEIVGNIYDNKEKTNAGN